MEKQTILLYGRTNSGKSAQIGKLAEHIFKTTGKRTRLYTGDRGGIKTIEPYIQLGVIEAVQMGETNPFIFIDKASRGCVRDFTGKWIPGDLEGVGMLAYESMRAFAEALMAHMAEKAAQNISIGGGSNISFKVEGDGETLTVSGGNMAHFGVAQARMTEVIWRSQKNDVPVVMWTSSVSKDEDTNSGGKVLGPDVIGKALTNEVPRWFDLTFRIDVTPAGMGKKEEHVLYLGSHTDLQAGNASALGNIRKPLDAPDLDMVIKPADIVLALERLKGGKDSAIEVIRKRLNLEKPISNRVSDVG